MRLPFVFIALTLIGGAITWMTTWLLISDSLYFSGLSQQFTHEQILELLNKNNKWKWLGYLLLPLIYLIKCSLVAFCLSVGLFLFNNTFAFKKMFAVAVIGEFVFLVPALAKLLWFLFVKTDYTLQDLQFFYPLSAMNIFEYAGIEPWLLYPLQILNFFEVVYWIVLAWTITREFPEFNLSRSMNLVASSYGLGLLVWITSIMFITLTYG